MLHDINSDPFVISSNERYLLPAEWSVFITWLNENKNKCFTWEDKDSFYWVDYIDWIPVGVVFHWENPPEWFKELGLYTFMESLDGIKESKILWRINPIVWDVYRFSNEPFKDYKEAIFIGTHNWKFVAATWDIVSSYEYIKNQETKYYRIELTQKQYETLSLSHTLYPINNQ